MLSGDQDDDNKIFKSIAVLYLENLSNDSEGEVEVESDHETVKFSVGDFVVFPKGLKCRWKVTKPVRKHYSFSCRGHLTKLNEHISDDYSRCFAGGLFFTCTVPVFRSEKSVHRPAG